MELYLATFMKMMVLSMIKIWALSYFPGIMKNLPKKGEEFTSIHNYILISCSTYLIIYICLTDYPKTDWHKTIILLYCRTL